MRYTFHATLFLSGSLNVIMLLWLVFSKPAPAEENEAARGRSSFRDIQQLGQSTEELEARLGHLDELMIQRRVKPVADPDEPPVMQTLVRVSKDRVRRMAVFTRNNSLSKTALACLNSDESSTQKLQEEVGEIYASLNTRRKQPPTNDNPLLGTGYTMVPDPMAVENYERQIGELFGRYAQPALAELLTEAARPIKWSGGLSGFTLITPNRHDGLPNLNMIRTYRGGSTNLRHFNTELSGSQNESPNPGGSKE